MKKAETLCSAIRSHAGADVYARLLQECGALEERPTPAQQAGYVTALLDKLPQQCGADVIAEIMRSCGGSCLSNKTVEKAKKLYAGSVGLEDFLDRLNQNHIGGGQLRLQGGRVIGVYDTCYCGLAKRAKRLPPDYCHCSAGWYQKLFGAVLGGEVVVRKLQTILDGAEACVFEIDLGAIGVCLDTQL